MSCALLKALQSSPQKGWTCGRRTCKACAEAEAVATSPFRQPHSASSLSLLVYRRSDFHRSSGLVCQRPMLLPTRLDPAWILETYQLSLKQQLGRSTTSCQVSGRATNSFALSAQDCQRMRLALPPTIPGCPKYFLNHLNQAKAACSLLGRTPDFFLTITSNEFQWLEIQDASARVRALMALPENHELRNAFTRAPCEVGRLFCHVSSRGGGPGSAVVTLLPVTIGKGRCVLTVVK